MLVSNLEFKLASIVDFNGKSYELSEIEKITTFDSKIIIEKILSSTNSNGNIEKIKISENLIGKLMKLQKKLFQ